MSQTARYDNETTAYKQHAERYDNRYWYNCVGSLGLFFIRYYLHISLYQQEKLT